MNPLIQNNAAQSAKDNLIKKLIKRATDTGLDQDIQFARLLNLIKINPEDQQISDLILEKLDEAEMENLIDPNPYRATNRRNICLPGQIGIGVIPPNNVPYMVPMELLTNHILICGRTGGGKTNLIFLILVQLLEANSNA